MRQLLVSNGTAVTYTNNVLAAGAIDIIKRSADGHTPLLPGDTITASDEIAFLLGGTAAEGNIFSTWIPGRDIEGWFGRSYTAQAAQVTTLSVATNATAAGEATFKVIDQSAYAEPFRRRSATVPVAAAATPAIVMQDIVDSLCGLVNSAPATAHPILGLGGATIAYTNASPSVVTITGATFGLTANTELSNLVWASAGLNGANGMVITVTAPTTLPSLGFGDANVLSQIESSLQADRGIHNRILQPILPNSYIDLVTPGTYDVYTLRFGNSTPGSIFGVDNKREITIARLSTAAAGVISAFEGKINPYVVSCPGAFAAVNL